MSVHDWTRVEAGIFHDFHTAWIMEIRSTLNNGLLPSDYYALAEQHAGCYVADLLTLHDNSAPAEPPSSPATAGSLALAEAPPRVRRQMAASMSAQLRRTLAIRHVSGHRLVALVEILSPANKDRSKSVEKFVTKAVDALDHGIHLLLVDLFPPGPHDPKGMHDAIWRMLDDAAESYDLPPAEPLTLASYLAGAPVQAFLEHVAVGAVLPAMPLFLHDERYVNVPLESTYQAAFHGMPAYWRKILERPRGVDQTSVSSRG